MVAHLPQFRRLVGILLRLPVVVSLGGLWVACIWWWIVGLSFMLATLVLIMFPILYPLAWCVEWLALAFKNSGDPVLPEYWKGYPDKYVDWCRTCIKLGFPTLRRWLMEGWHS